MSSAHHSRKPSSRTALPRRTTKGPLDAPTDPLALSTTPVPSPQNHTAQLSPKQEVSEPIEAAEPATRRPPAPSDQQQAAQTEDVAAVEERDLSFLLDASIYHPLSQLEIPGPFRKPFLPPLKPETPLQTAMQHLDSLLSQCDFLRAAQLAGSILVSGTVRPTDAKTIFRLLEIRYSCLELSGNLLFAAQEAKALEDLSSGFYYDEPAFERSADEDDLASTHKVPSHIMPFSLRLQALRLQSIGFSDPRRGVSTLYDVALECREHLSSPHTSPEQRELWAERLSEVSIRVVNALIEMGDIDCAVRTLQDMKPRTDDHLALWTSRMTLLRIKMGDIVGAQKLIDSGKLGSQDRLILGSLLAIAEGRYDDTTAGLSDNEASANSELAALVKQNLAVAYLYRGEVRKSRQILEKLVNDGHSFQTLTINLATIYDLTSDRSRELKTSMASQIASRQRESGYLRAFVNADFKL
ncbi:hypothetical protein AYO20_02692 [Fonsecaea nubica]|uniref:Uncharacterized protein n=1 Tax=Fonsecaea nubica TaxID=856822 RepID=A0A178D6W4_9EURO|nr:hypothetical protein AYO20_02692 [Fonsecaea nubica]OAL37859.1 hypothetical protein AYO20_02692 [Fonsecaea nubica]